MFSRARTSFALLIAATAFAAAAPVARAAFGVEEQNFEAGTCLNSTCTYKSVEEHPGEAFTQAAGHPPWGLTTFVLNHKKGLLGEEPEGALKRVRVDIPPGLAADPQAPERCAVAAFMANKCPPGSEVGSNNLEVFAGVSKVAGTDEALTATVYNLEQPAGLPLDFGIHVTLTEPAINEHVFLEGHVSWHTEKLLEERGIPSGDYHEYFEINNISGTKEKAEQTPVLKSKLNFKGTKTGEGAYGNFLTLPSECSATTTSYIEVESWTGARGETLTRTPVGVEHCELPPFGPTAALSGETTQSDTPDGASTEVAVKQNSGGEELNTADVKDARVTLPEGLTLNPSAARGLEACTPEEIAIGGEAEVRCPPASKVGTVAIETDLPPGALTGNVYLGNPGVGPIAGPPYTIYVDAEAPAYGVSVRLRGTVNPDPGTGRLETTFADNPQLPFSQLVLKLDGGPLAPVANPLSCEAGKLEALFTPYTGEPAALSVSPFAATGCPAPLPFSLAASAAHVPASAGAHTTFTYSLAREDGQQYLARVSTTLPAGLVGAIPAVERCGEPQAASGACGAASRIGTATVAVGAGAEPYTFTGPAFLTGRYAGAPFGLSIAVPAVAGPFNLGTVVTRATVNVDASTARVTVAGAVPTIVGGVPLRIRSVTLAVERPGFLLNPTSCGEEAVETTLGSTLAATQVLSTPFASSACGALGFTPTFAASSDAHATKANGMSLRTTVSQAPGQANIRTVVVQLPKQSSTRLTTLQQACLAARFAAGPGGCPAGSLVGRATATTPVLPGTMSGPAYLVSHGGEAFPDIDIVLEGSGVRIVLVGNTNITGGVTRTTFATLPDVPVSSFVLDLPTGPHSVLTANSDLCASPLEMPTTIVAQNGATVHQITHVAVSGCARKGIKIISRKIRGHTLLLAVRTFAAGRVIVRGKYLRGASRSLRAPAKVTLKLSLSTGGLAILRARHRLRVSVRVRFAPAQAGVGASSASTAVTFRR